MFDKFCRSSKIIYSNKHIDNNDINRSGTSTTGDFWGFSVASLILRSIIFTFGNNKNRCSFVKTRFLFVFKQFLYLYYLLLISYD